MANASTIRRQVSGTQQLTLVPSITPGATLTNFTLNNNGLTLTGGGVIPLSIGVTGLYAGTGQVIHVGAAGTFSGATSGTSTIKLSLYEVPAAIIAAGGLTAGSQTNFNVVCTFTSGVVSGTSGSFQLDAYLQIDANGNLTGQYQIAVDGATSGIVGPALTTEVTGLAGEVDLNFVVSASTPAGGGSLTVNELRADLE